MRLVLDTATMVAAIRSDAGASRRLLRGALDRRFTLLASVALLIEYESVLTRQDHRSASGLSVDDVQKLLDTVASVIEPVSLDYAWRPQLADPDDDMVLDAAINGRADAIVTFNIRDFREGAARFGIRIVSPGNAVRMMKESQ
ncbi:putative toxin-antitoxin system toxin component, PIN family [Aureimonas psammosilenae]|uniref:putative toxin-antitoxin system toxin component, PIN family n=1 Tax=Aureimonas psammosilenae TaxID=2495496 RepID=UPI001260E60B|nr:putative toxin-antitoxin system toxin component, PIN family [Aureimonas psammosilenae]